MTEFPRDFFLNDPVFKQLFVSLRDNHKVADHTQKILTENKHIQGFCEEATHFAILPGKNPVYVSYDVTTQLRDGRAAVTFDKIAVYDNVMEVQRCQDKRPVCQAVHRASDTRPPHFTNAK